MRFCVCVCVTFFSPSREAYRFAELILVSTWLFLLLPEMRYFCILASFFCQLNWSDTKTKCISGCHIKSMRNDVCLYVKFEHIRRKEREFIRMTDAPNNTIKTICVRREDSNSYTKSHMPKGKKNALNVSREKRNTSTTHTSIKVAWFPKCTV